MCLGIGLVLRDTHTIQFDLGEDDSDEHLPPSIRYLKSSKFGWSEAQVMWSCCQEMWTDIQLCFNQAELPDTPPKTEKKYRGPAGRRYAKPAKPLQRGSRKAAAATAGKL
jgi:hypothetical protein